MSAVLPEPVPGHPRHGDDRHHPGGEPAGGTAPGTVDAARRRPLTLAPDPGRPGDGPGAADDGTAARPTVRVRLVPRVEAPATALAADGPAHLRPPALGSPGALARPRPLTVDAEDGPAAPAAQPLPDPTRLCCAVVQAAVEGLRGVRPLAQLTRWVTPEVYDRLALRARLVQSASPPVSAARAGIRRVRVCRIGDGAAEATVVVDDGPRVRAVALRVEEHRGRWRAVVLEIG